MFWKDLSEAKDEIVISSPMINHNKVAKIIELLENRIELGLKVTILTMNPDTYKYDNSNDIMELVESLRQSGFEIKLIEDSCEHYAVIDKEIVWYGSVNLLSKEDIDDNLMRICSKDIASELLELSCGIEKILLELY